MTKNIEEKDLENVSGGMDLSRADDTSRQVASMETKVDRISKPPVEEEEGTGASGGGNGTFLDQNPPAGLGD